MNRYIRQGTLASVLMSLSALAWSVDPAEAEMPQAQFHFKHQTISLGSQFQDEKFWRDEGNSQNLSIMHNDDLFGTVNQYDATISYPFASQKNLNFDLGVNLRFIEADLTQGDLSPVGYKVNRTLPMFYANALYTLPNSGLSASFGASHFEHAQYFAFDYKAKLSYQWENGLGLEGGWQHQQLNIDGGDLQADIENKGPFLDFKYRF